MRFVSRNETLISGMVTLWLYRPEAIQTDCGVVWAGSCHSKVMPLEQFEARYCFTIGRGECLEIAIENVMPWGWEFMLYCNSIREGGG